MEESSKMELLDPQFSIRKYSFVSFRTKRVKWNDMNKENYDLFRYFSFEDEKLFGGK